MHELGPVTSAVVALLAAVGQRPLATVAVALGPGLDPAAARAAWVQATAGTAAADAAVTWQLAQDTLRCLGCARDYPGDRLARCPGCGGDGLVVAAVPAIAVTGWQAREAG